VRAAVGRIGRIVRVLPKAVTKSDDAPGGLLFVIVAVATAAPQELADAAALPLSAITAMRLVEAQPETPVDDDAFDRASRKGVVRVEVGKLDGALERLAGLAIGRAQMRAEIQRLAATRDDVRRLAALLDDDARQMRRLRAALLELRMVPLREVLEPLPLIVRGLRNSTGKHAQLEIDVGDAELDKTVAERLFPALVHLVRNAVDHGIEDAATRRALGKPEDGVVRIRAGAPSTSMLDIEVCDDGGGIDARKVALRAEAPVPTDDAALLDILTSPGFTMRDTITTTSGRGLGLDIVRQTVETLGGTLELENRPGSGTTMRIRAPLTVAMVDAFAFEAGAERYLAPISVVDAIVEVDEAGVVQPPGGGRTDTAVSLLRTRGDVVPLVSLPAALGLTADATLAAKAMIVRRHGVPFAFGIDRMLGRHEVLVRPLADALVRVAGVTGSADLGDGRPTLVLDLFALTARMARRTAEASA
jgi:two-component system chemotaxis sensor kinase CheA